VTASSSGPYTLAHGDTLIADIEGVGDQTLTFTATAAARESTGTETFALSNGQTLTVKIDRGGVQTVEFNTGEFVAIGAATAEEVAAVINAELVGASAAATSGGTKVTITSDKLGLDSYVEVTGGTANGVLAFNVAEVQGTGNVNDITSVTVSELITLCDATFTNGSGVACANVGGALSIVTVLTGASASVAINATSTADSKIGLDNATHTGFSGAAQNTLKFTGKYYGSTVGNSLAVAITAADSGTASEFNVLVYLSGVLRETFRNVTMDSTADNYVETVMNVNAGRSALVAAADQSATGTPTQRRPANIAATSLAGGNDGLASIADADFSGTSASAAGIRALDSLSLIDQGDIMVCPDRATEAVQDAGAAYCEDQLKQTCVFIPVTPVSTSYTSAQTHATSLDASEQRTGCLWPWVKCANPDKAVFGTAEELTVSPDCMWAATMARNGQQMEERMFNQPGNPMYGELKGATGIETDIGNKSWVREAVAPFRINTVRWGKLPTGQYGAWVDDVMSGKSTGNWLSVGEQRGVAHIKKTIALYMETRRTQPNNQKNRKIDEIVITGYLEGWTSKGAFASQNPEEAFYVNTDPEGLTINNPTEQAAENYNVQIGLLTARAGRYQNLQFTRTSKDVEIRLAATANQP